MQENRAEFKDYNPMRTAARWLRPKWQKLPTLTPSAWQSMPSGWQSLRKKRRNSSQMMKVFSVSIAKQMDRTKSGCYWWKLCMQWCWWAWAYWWLKIKAWAEHYAWLLSVEFEWPSNELPKVFLLPTPFSVCPRPWSAKYLARWNTTRLAAHLTS